MDKSYLQIFGELDAEDQRLIKTYLKKLMEYKDSGEAETRIKEKLKEISARLKQLEEKALSRTEERRKNPKCTFCGKKASDVTKMFRKTEYLHICCECVKSCYEELQRDGKNAF